jgi:hypothetical protein
MNLEKGRNIFRSIVILISDVLAYWVNLTAGLMLTVFIGVMILQSVFTDWCPSGFNSSPDGTEKEIVNTAR